MGRKRSAALDVAGHRGRLEKAEQLNCNADHVNDQLWQDLAEIDNLHAPARAIEHLDSALECLREFGDESATFTAIHLIRRARRQIEFVHSIPGRTVCASVKA